MNDFKIEREGFTLGPEPEIPEVSVKPTRREIRARLNGWMDCWELICSTGDYPDEAYIHWVAKKSGRKVPVMEGSGVG